MLNYFLYSEEVALCCCGCRSEMIAAQFTRLDINSDGSLSPEELVQAIMQSTGLKHDDALHFIAKFDIDGNGQIDQKEFTSMWSLMFG